MSLLIKMRPRTVWTPRVVLRKAKSASKRAMFKGGAAVMRVARRTIITRKKSAPVGQQPHTRRGQLRRAIVFDVDQSVPSAIIGPRASFVGISGAQHETGRPYRGEQLPKRSYMKPALDVVGPRMAGFYADSIKN